MPTLCRSEVLIKRALLISSSHIDPSIVDFERSVLEEFDYEEYVILRSANDILAVFLVDNWQVSMLEPEKWPDYLLDEAVLVKE
jgi:hypothetical protein